ncbi:MULTISPECIES: serine/threonine-protein kinase [Nostocales]|uniref:serine/threonine protein kinase n=1 Tax=Nostocales TaxID=1161 RepID=UPI0016860F42|nr:MULTISPECIES: serine/threonine-protein kinase [Nostocales]MBD2303161.1 serine/threonine protein kinase [Nostoc sp. FACHB-190]MBD2492339.1 serine/threonine protein kinase [Aulosira sp. FACHB-615]
MSLCINPVCPKPNNQDNDKHRFCQSCGSPLELPGRYRVIRLLSDKTGFGKVYEAHTNDTPNILKVLREELSNDAAAIKIFQQEATVLGQLHHPGIPKVDGYFQYQTRDGLILHCTAMEKIDGWDLEQWMNQQQYRPISQTQAIAWLQQLAEILNLVHSKQYLHQDIKPSHIKLRSNGQLVLVDFGTSQAVSRQYLAQFNHGGEMTSIISSGYGALEQMQGQAVPQSDFFALGRTFAFLLTGRHPLDMYDARKNLLQWRNFASHVSPGLLDLVDWLMATQITDRPKNAQEILQQLGEIEQQYVQLNLTSNLQEKYFSPTVAKTEIGDKLPLIAFLAALMVSLSVISVMALGMRSPKISTLITQTQAPEAKGKIEFFGYQEGRDSQGKTAEFSIAILSTEYKWLLNSSFQIKYNDQVVSVDFLKLNLEQEGIQKIMEYPTEIISVGTATCEGNLVVAQRLALERAKQLQLLSQKLFKNTSSVKGYRLLNLGQFQRGKCPSNQDITDYQSSIIIIGIRKKSKGVIVDEALRYRLINQPFADFKLDDYSLGSVDKFTTIPQPILIRGRAANKW